MHQDTSVTNQELPKKHVIITCYDGRNDGIVSRMAEEIRSKGGILTEKDILRPPGGVHLLAGNRSCRETFYRTLISYRDIAGTTAFHLLPHTNCIYCGKHHQEKIGNGTQSDLRFHLLSAEKLRDGAINHFRDVGGVMPEIDVRIILTVDQLIVTTEEASDLLPLIHPDHGHGHHCCSNLAALPQLA